MATTSKKTSVKVIRAFRDKYDKTQLYEVGTVIKVDKDRADNLIRRGLAAAVVTAG